MAVAFQTVSAAVVGAATGGATLVIPKPAGTVDGDLLLAVVTWPTASGMIPPPGWTSFVLITDANQLHYTQVLYRVAASEGASYSFTIPDGFPTAAVGIIGRYSGVNTSAPIDAVASQTANTVATATAPSVTPTATGDMLVAFFSAKATNGTAITSTPPGGMTERADTYKTQSIGGDYPAYNDLQASLCDVLLGSTAPTGAKTATISVTAEATAGVAVLLRPFEEPPPPPPAVLGLHMVV